MAIDRGKSSSSDMRTQVPQFRERELHIEIYPRGYDIWVGTSAQLKAEGLIPPAFEWPFGLGDRYWRDGPFDYWLCRSRPEGHKGPQSSYMQLDNWRCRRTPAVDRYSGFRNAQIFEKRAALAEELSRQTPSGDIQFSKYSATLADRAYQAFRALVVPQKTRRGRARTSQTDKSA